MNFKIVQLLVLLLLLQFSNCLYAEIKVPALFCDHMVLQQNAKVKIWGWAASEEKINIKTSWNKSEINITSDEKGEWHAWLRTKQYGGPYTIIITGSDSHKVIKDILFGEVWICSGQSNMEMPLMGWPLQGNSIEGSKQAIEDAYNKDIRLFNVQRTVSFTPKNACVGEWKISAPETAGYFSAVGYFFAKMLNDSLQIPIGMISAPWGGSPVEAWIPFDVVKNESIYKDLLNEREEELKASEKTKEVVVQEFQNWLKNASEKGTNDTDFIDIKLPSTFEKSTLGSFEGAVCLRNEINLPVNWEQQALTISLGTIDDIGQVFINNKLVWEELLPSHSYAKCKLKLPANTLKKGNNSIEVKLLNILWGGGLTGTAEEMFIHPENNTDVKLDLSGMWKAKKLFSMQEVSPMPKEGVPNFVMASALYNGMIHPLISYPVKGFLWYQGEANVDKAAQYKESFTSMIESWRKKWNAKHLPFYYAQIAPYQYEGDTSTMSAYLREAQFKTLDLDNTGMAVTLDIGSSKNIHPPKKKQVGQRLALLALNKDYHYSNLVYSGPVYNSYSIKKNTIIIKLKHTNKGILIKNTAAEFEICGSDKIFRPAQVAISGKCLVVSHPDISKPIAVRYAWRNSADANLFNSSGLPASSFRTDDWEIDK